jgi:hypothetical protein
MKYTKEIYEYDGDIFHVLSQPNKEIAIFENEIGYDVTGMTEVFDGEIIHQEEIESELDFEDFTNLYVDKFKKY